ncbi:hypothetical protein DTO207G8_4842 [Paecilomyces variotii]|nr:hypothetical protein DTO207G8_4842 [Paecilomyces variotii]
MDSEIPLPPPRRIRHRSPTKQASAQSIHEAVFHKPHRPSRSRLDDLSSQPSSDPALFSSDDTPASGLENYHHGVSCGGLSRKRRYRGTWWGEMVMDPKRKRADFKEKRNVDSGVWMASDDSSVELFSSTSEDANSCGEDFLKNATDSKTTRWSSSNAITDAISKGHQESRNGPVVQPRAAFRREEPKEHQVARSIVNDCLDKGQDGIDLSHGDLKTIPNGLLRPLLHLTKQPCVKEAPVTEEVYSSLEPFLQLFLSGNLLTSLPAELFELGSLKVLSLRNNKLHELPAAIRKLTMLQEINVSVNRLQYLPWELLWLIWKGDLKHVTLRPNPFLQIEDATIEEWHYKTPDGQIPSKEDTRLFEYEGPAPEEAWAPIHVATGPVSFFNMEGLPVAEGKSFNKYKNSTNSSRVPSLRELSLLACNQNPYFDQLLASDLSYFPSPVVRLLQQARDIRDVGGRSCSVCHRSFVVPRTQWIEWWDCTTYESGLKGPRPSNEKLRPLPFLRRGCSWACVPGADKDLTERKHPWKR